MVLDRCFLRENLVAGDEEETADEFVINPFVGRSVEELWVTLPPFSFPGFENVRLEREWGDQGAETEEEEKDLGS